MDFVTAVEIGDWDQAELDGDRGMQGLYDRIDNKITLYAKDISIELLSVSSLGTFVHELTHAWQDVTGYLNPDGSGSPSDNRYESTIYQLYYVQLDNEQMAKAVQQHYVNMHAQGAAPASSSFAWWNNYGLDPEAWVSREERVEMASSWLYQPLLNVIRAPIIKATTLGGIKGGL